MVPDDMMPVAAEQDQLWTLSEDRRFVCMAVPPLPIEGLPEPAEVVMDFDAPPLLISSSV